MCPFEHISDKQESPVMSWCCNKENKWKALFLETKSKRRFEFYTSFSLSFLSPVTYLPVTWIWMWPASRRSCESVCPCVCVSPTKGCPLLLESTVSITWGGTRGTLQKSSVCQGMKSLQMTQLTQITTMLSSNVYMLLLTLLVDICYRRLFTIYLQFPTFITITHIHACITLGQGHGRVHILRL